MYTIEQRVEITEIHFKNGENFAEIIRKRRTFFGYRKSFSRNTVVNLINKFEPNRSVLNKKSSRCPHTTPFNEDTASVT